jgi:hypothetical protein
VLAVLGALAKRPGPKVPATDWEKWLEAMPGDASPKQMFRTITAIRENTDRILPLLEPGQSEPRTTNRGSRAICPGRLITSGLMSP